MVLISTAEVHSPMTSAFRNIKPPKPFMGSYQGPFLEANEVIIVAANYSTAEQHLRTLPTTLFSEGQPLTPLQMLFLHQPLETLQVAVSKTCRTQSVLALCLPSPGSAGW